jgi:enoyl-CoA hydratase
MPEYENIQVETRQNVGLIRLYRPRAANALSSALLGELMAALRAFDEDPLVGAVVITGSERIFSPGADIKEMQGAGAVEMLQRDQLALFDQFPQLKKPVIAAVSGWCLGGGNELAMACDMIVASESAKFGQPEINLGVIPGAGGTQRLTRAVGKAIAMEMILNNRTLSAEEALRFGLINRVVPVESYLDEALALAAEIAGRAPLAVRMAKTAINQAFEATLTEGVATERRLFYLLFASEDQKEGMAAFVEKRPPAWQGR